MHHRRAAIERKAPLPRPKCDLLRFWSVYYSLKLFEHRERVLVCCYIQHHAHSARAYLIRTKQENNRGEILFYPRVLLLRDRKPMRAIPLASKARLPGIGTLVR